MKKQLIAKLLVLGMVLAMLPTAALASANTATDASNNTYVYDFGFIFDDYTFSGAETPAEPEKPAEPETPAETTPVETETNADGQVVATVTVEAEVKGNTATVAVTAETWSASWWTARPTCWCCLWPLRALPRLLCLYPPPLWLRWLLGPTLL